MQVGSDLLTTGSRLAGLGFGFVALLFAVTIGVFCSRRYSHHGHDLTEYRRPQSPHRFSVDIGLYVLGSTDFNVALNISNPPVVLRRRLYRLRQDWSDMEE